MEIVRQTKRKFGKKTPEEDELFRAFLSLILCVEWSEPFVGVGVLWGLIFGEEFTVDDPGDHRADCRHNEKEPNLGNRVGVLRNRLHECRA